MRQLLQCQHQAFVIPVVLEDYRGLSVSIGCLSQQPGSGLRGSFGVGRHYCPQVGGT